ncbi:MAG TPA: ribosome maturation factor RimP [Savagea sp.]
MSKAIITKVEQLTEPIVDELQLELVDVEFVKEGADWFLRVYVDAQEGRIDIDQCALVSERLSDELDQDDPIEQNYFLEVSSPGAERPLKKEEDFVQAVDSFVFIKTYAPIDGIKEFEGYLIENDETSVRLSIRIKTRTVEVTIPKQQIALARLAIDF